MLRLSVPIFILIAVLASGCGGGGTQKKDEGPPGATRGGRRGSMASEVAIKTTRVQRISIQRTVDIAGSLVSLDRANVSSEVSGVVEQVLVQLGQEVQPGQIIVKLSPRELELALEKARSQLRQTQAQLGIDGKQAGESRFLFA